LPHIPQEIHISKETWNEAKRLIKNGIIKKLSAAKQNIDIDTEIAAGIYIYALEEFGKLLLLKESQIVDGKYIIKYRDGFRSHEFKFNKAFDYLQNNGYGKCIILNNDDGAFTPDAFSWRSFTIGLLAQTEARLGIFYVDFTKFENDNYGILKIPTVDKNKLNEAINKLEEVINLFEFE
jgi:hypothetical protein